MCLFLVSFHPSTHPSIHPSVHFVIILFMTAKLPWFGPCAECWMKEHKLATSFFLQSSKEEAQIVNPEQSLKQHR